MLIENELKSISDIFLFATIFTLKFREVFFYDTYFT